MNSIISITIILCFGIHLVMSSDVEKEDIKTKPKSVNLSKKELCKSLKMDIWIIKHSNKCSLKFFYTSASVIEMLCFLLLI